MGVEILWKFNELFRDVNDDVYSYFSVVKIVSRFMCILKVRILNSFKSYVEFVLFFICFLVLLVLGK